LQTDRCRDQRWSKANALPQDTGDQGANRPDTPGKEAHGPVHSSLHLMRSNGLLQTLLINGGDWSSNRRDKAGGDEKQYGTKE